MYFNKICVFSVFLDSQKQMPSPDVILKMAENILKQTNKEKLIKYVNEI